MRTVKHLVHEERISETEKNTIFPKGEQHFVLFHKSDVVKKIRMGIPIRIFLKVLVNND